MLHLLSSSQFCISLSAQPQHTSYLWQTAVAAAAREPHRLEGQPSSRQEQPASPVHLCIVPPQSGLSDCPAYQFLKAKCFYISSNKIRIDIACTCQFLLLQLYRMSSASLGHWQMHIPSCRQAYSVFIWASYFSSFQHLVLVASRMPVLLRWAVTRGEGHLSGNMWEVTIVEWMKDDPACWGHSCATGPPTHKPAL